eukprot:TRINITY_DN19431_c0_g1_i1.p1 TRINITY_DN19431_c0_g1~~TRINITY_DN19431_c0_g1_i1.p1  ORF type:complete len:844 (+),score=241.21 TRINITY_DN19431_c0_g1_i1:225-2756(+)
MGSGGSKKAVGAAQHEQALVQRERWAARRTNSGSSHRPRSVDAEGRAGSDGVVLTNFDRSSRPSLSRQASVSTQTDEPSAARHGPTDGAAGERQHGDGLRELAGSNSVLHAEMAATRERLQLIVQVESLRAELAQSRADADRLQAELAAASAGPTPAETSLQADLDAARSQLARIMHLNNTLTAELQQLRSAETPTSPRTGHVASSSETDELRLELEQHRKSERGLAAHNTALLAKISTLEWELSLLRSDIALHQAHPKPAVAIPEEYKELPAEVFVSFSAESGTDVAKSIAAALRPTHRCYLHSSRGVDSIHVAHLVAQCDVVLLLFTDDASFDDVDRWSRDLDCAVHSRKQVLVCCYADVRIPHQAPRLVGAELHRRVTSLPCASLQAGPAFSLSFAALRDRFLGPDRATREWYRGLERPVREDHVSRRVTLHSARAPLWRLLFALQFYDAELFARVTDVTLEHTTGFGYRDWSTRIDVMPALRAVHLEQPELDEPSFGCLARILCGAETFRAKFSEQGGQLVTDNWFAILAETAPRLHSLSLDNCSTLSLGGLAALAGRDRLLRLALRRFPQGADGLKAFKAGFESIEELDLSGTDRMWDSSLGVIGKGCPRLRSLDVASWTMFGTGLKLLAANCATLECLCLAHCNVTDKSLEPLQKCTTLRQLDVGYSKVSDDGLAALSAACTRLSHLRLAGCQIRGPGLEQVARSCPCLEAVDLTDCEVTCSELMPFVRVAACLQALRIDKTEHLGDAALRAVADCCRALRRFSAADAADVTDAGLSHLETGCPLLESLCVADSSVSSAALARFARARPSVRIQSVSVVSATDLFWTFPLPKIPGVT